MLGLFNDNVTLVGNKKEPKRTAAINAGLACKSYGGLPYGKESDQYPKLQRAIAIDETAALKTQSRWLTSVMLRTRCASA